MILFAAVNVVLVVVAVTFQRERQSEREGENVGLHFDERVNHMVRVPIGNARENREIIIHCHRRQPQAIKLLIAMYVEFN